MNINGNNAGWNEFNKIPVENYSVDRQLQQNFNNSQLSLVNRWNVSQKTQHNQRQFERSSNESFNDNARDHYGLNNCVGNPENPTTTFNSFPGSGNASGFNGRYLNQPADNQNNDYYVPRMNCKHEPNVVLPYHDLKNKFQALSLTYDYLPPRFEKQQPKPHQEPCNDVFPSRHNSNFEYPSIFDKTKIPSLPSISPISSNNETSGNGEDSEGSFRSKPSIKKSGEKRGRKPKYLNKIDKKSAQNKNQKEYLKRIKAYFEGLKIEVPNLERENFELKKQKQSLLKIAREMLSHPDLPELDRSVVGAIIGFE